MKTEDFKKRIEIINKLIRSENAEDVKLGLSLVGFEEAEAITIYEAYSNAAVDHPEEIFDHFARCLSKKKDGEEQT